MTGSVQRKNGIWHMVINLKDAKGKRRPKWISTKLPIKGNKRKAELMLAEALTEYSKTGYVEPTKILLCDHIRNWVEASETRVQATTYMNYVHVVEKHLYPYFAALNIKLADVTPDTIKEYHLAKAGTISNNTIIKHISLMRTAIQTTVGLPPKLFRANPCDLVESIDKPKRKKYRAEWYNTDEIRELLIAAKDAPIKLPIFLASYFSLTRSECLGLRWNAIDFAERTLTVKRKVVRAKVNGKLVNLDSDELKTEARYRVLPLDDWLIKFFLKEKEQQERNKELCGTSYCKDYLSHVCVDVMGKLINPDYVTSKFPELLKEYGMKRIRFHDLRHSCASLLLSLRYSMKDIQEWLGHSNYQTTANTYSHVDPKNKKGMIEGLTSTLV